MVRVLTKQVSVFRRGAVLATLAMLAMVAAAGRASPAGPVVGIVRTSDDGGY